MNNYTIYPNPTSSNFTLENALGATINVTDVSGKVIVSIASYQGEAIDVSKLSNGVYTILISNSGNYGTTRLIQKNRNQP